MANNNDIFELVEAYLNGELSGSELANFEAELTTNEALQKQLKLAKAAQKLVIQNRLLHVKALANEESTRIKTKRNKTQKYIVGGSIGLVAVVTGLFIMTKSNESNEIKSPQPQEIKQTETIISTPGTVKRLKTQSLFLSLRLTLRLKRRANLNR